MHPTLSLLARPPGPSHGNPRSFCHGVLERFTAGLTDAGQPSEIVDLHAINFDSVFRGRDAPSSIGGDIPPAATDRLDSELTQRHPNADTA